MPTTSRIFNPLISQAFFLLLVFFPPILQGNSCFTTANRMIPKIADEQWAKDRSRQVKSYVRYVQQFGKTPSLEEFQQFMKIQEIEPQEFFDLADIKQAAVIRSPKSFAKILDREIFNPGKRAKILAALQEGAHFFVTTALANSATNQEFLQAMLRFCDENNGHILIIPANGESFFLDPLLHQNPRIHVLWEPLELSPFWAIDTIAIPPQNVQPLSGLDRLGQRNQSRIVGSPKFHLKIIPTIHAGNDYSPHRLMSTGTLSKPLYQQNRPFPQTKIQRQALEDHFYGAILLSKVGYEQDLGIDGEWGQFFYQQIPFDPQRGGFISAGKFYTASEKKTAKILAIDPGDIHVGDTDQRALLALQQFIDKYSPQYVVLHDIFNGHSLGHHDRQKLVTLSQKAEFGLLNVQKELKAVYLLINALLENNPSLKLLIPTSNHNNWLHRWLQEGTFISDPQNAVLGAELFRKYAEGSDPFEYALRTYGINKRQQSRVIFIPPGNSFKIGPYDLHFQDPRLVEVGQHGHAGANGAKGSKNSFQKAAGAISYGHTHTIERLNHLTNNGTLTNKLLSYNQDGLSSWAQGMNVIYENGQQLLLEFQFGSFFPTPYPKKYYGHFFLPGHPRINELDTKE